MLRALLLGLAFAALTFGIFLLLRKFLPELLDGSNPRAETDGQSGSLVDILVQDGEGELAGFSPASAPGASPSDGLVRDDPILAREAISAGAAEADDGEMEELEREVEDIRSEALLPSDAPGSSGPSMPARPSVALDELDVLPDLDSMSDSFAAEAVSGLGAEDGYDPAGHASSAAGSGGGADPAALAKAVQTLLRRDQKG